jgi:DNA-binding NarL/FixJ family response regulator
MGYHDRLTRQQWLVLELLVTEGLSNRELAARLFLAESTIEEHIANICHRLEVKTCRKAVAYAIRHHLFENTTQEIPIVLSLSRSR